MAVAARPRRASLPLQGGSEGAGVAVTPLRTAEMLVSPRFLQRARGPLAGLRDLLAPRRRRTAVPVPCFLVEHPTAGPFLVDTGMAPAVAERGARALGRRAGLVLRIRMQPTWASSDQLRARGLDPLGLRLVVMTHLHLDHAGAVAEYPHATFVVDRAEWDAAAGGGLSDGYVRRLFDHPVEWRTLDFGAREVGSFASFARTLDLFGDGSVRLLSTPGHSAGHMSVLLRLSSGGELLLAGDAAFAARTIDEGLVPTICADVHRYRRSLGEIRRFVEMTPGAAVVCGHDAERWPALPERFA
jgi:N-acyl homoserine lactone hydrolase